MVKALFLIKWREKLARQVIQIWSVVDLANKFKPDCLFKMLVFWLFENKLVTLLIFTIVSRVKIQLIYNSSYRNK